MKIIEADNNVRPVQLDYIFVSLLLVEDARIRKHRKNQYTEWLPASSYARHGAS